MNNQELGQIGENLACDYLQKEQYEVIDRNWRCAQGEVDLVAVDPENTLVFVEVKSRRSVRCGTPAEAITVKKLRTMRQVAGRWLQEHQNTFRRIRLDLICVTWDMHKAHIEHRRAIS